MATGRLAPFVPTYLLKKVAAQLTLMLACFAFCAGQVTVVLLPYRICSGLLDLDPFLLLFW